MSYHNVNTQFKHEVYDSMYTRLTTAYTYIYPTMRHPFKYKAININMVLEVYSLYVYILVRLPDMLCGNHEFRCWLYFYNLGYQFYILDIIMLQT